MATITVRAGHYILNWSHGGQRHRKSLGKVETLTKKQVADILKAKELGLSTGAQLLGLRTGPVLSFGQYAEGYLAWHGLEYPDSHYRIRQIVQQHILPVFGLVPLDAVSAKDVEAYKHRRRFSAKAETVAKELRTLKAILNRAAREGILDKNPAANVRPPKSLDSAPHRFYEAEELQRLYDKAFAPEKAAIWKLYANTGMRRMEGLHLRWKDVGATSIRILSTGEERTKSGHWREIPLSAGATAALEVLRGHSDLHVLPRLLPRSLSRAFENDAKRAGIDGHLHLLRHTYISHLVRAGIPLRTVQIYAGHANYSTTEKYAYLAPGAAPDVVLNLAL